jgi:hypothetical protein
MNKDVIAVLGADPTEACYALHARDWVARTQTLVPRPAVESS